MARAPRFGKSPNIENATANLPRLSNGPVLGGKRPKSGEPNNMAGNANMDPDLNPNNIKKSKAFKGLMQTLKAK